MSRYAIIDNGVVTNIVAADSALAVNWATVNSSVSIGDTTGDGVTFSHPAPDIAGLKTAKNLEINLARAAANQTTFPYAGKSIACDALSRSDIDGANGYIALNNALPPSWPGAWKATDNSYVLLSDVATWKLFYSAMVAQGTVNFNHSQTLKATLASASTAAEIAAVVW